MESIKRTVICGSLRKADVGKTVFLNGWVNRKRDHGGISFINLRDRYGITQAVVDTPADTEAAELSAGAELSAAGGFPPDPEAPPSAATLAALTAELRNGFCIAVEVLVRRLAILGRSETLPFQIDGESGAREELRLRYRYPDLRSAAMQRRIRLRSEVAFAVREWMTGQGFYEIETPAFIRSPRRIVEGLGAGPGDLIVADPKRRIANTALGAVRSKLGRDLGLAVCCASAQNRIKIHESEFLYPANCIRTKGSRSPIIEDFLHIYAKNPQVQQTASGRRAFRSAGSRAGPVCLCLDPGFSPLRV